MRKNAIFPVLLVIIALAVMLLAFRSRATRPDKEGSSKETLDACSGKKEGGKMIWENLSQQFFSSL